MERAGYDGRRVLRLLQHLPRNHVHRRNDFWDLGIVAGDGNMSNDDLDNISVVSATAAVAVPQTFTQVNMYSFVSIRGNYSFTFTHHAE